MIKAWTTARALALVCIASGCAPGVATDGGSVDADEDCAGGDFACPIIEWVQLEQSAMEGAATVSLGATLSFASAGTVTVSVVVSPDGTTATPGTDYALAAGSISFAPGELTSSLAVTLFDEDLIEYNETVVVRLTSPSNAALGRRQYMVLTLIDAQTPTNLAATAVSATQVDLTWTDNSSNEVGFGAQWANEYTPWQWSPMGGSPPDVTDGAMLNVQGNGIFYYRVSALTVWQSEHGEPSAALQVRTPAEVGVLPTAPSGLTVTDTFANEVDLSWQDGGTDDDGFRIERSTNPTSGFAYIGTTGPDISTYADLTAASGTTYYYRVKSFNVAGDSTPATPVSATTPAPQNIPDQPGTWLIVLTNRGTLVPATLRSLLCNPAPNGMQAALHTWMRREANKLVAAKAFDAIACLAEEVEIPASLHTAGTPTTMTLDQAGVIAFLEDPANTSPAGYAAIMAAQYVTVVHNLPAWEPMPEMSNYAGGRYAFHYFEPTAVPEILYPDSSYVDRMMLHEFLHFLGATDKYMTTPAAACSTNSATGKQHEGNDIMCHRVYDPFGLGYYMHPLPYLTISRATATEIY